MKIVNNFVWLLVTNKAKEVFTSGLFDVYSLHKDDSESLCESIHDINKSLESGKDLAIEVGFLDDSNEIVRNGKCWYVGKAEFTTYKEALNYNFEKQFQQ